jgi:predicted glycosyl hydrolase (DUF1957 family)
MTTFWAPLIHIYQPPTQEIDVLKLIDRECYKPLFSVIDEHENAKFCLNINGVLIDLLYEYGLSDTMDLLKNLVSENKIEILGTAKFHPILPLIPNKEIHHQIRMNEETNHKQFGDLWQKKGFFPPELAISSKVAKKLNELGYEWVILSGIACPNDWPYNVIYQSPNGLNLYFRDDILSNKISFKHINAKEFVKSLNEIFQDKSKKNSSDRYIITAMDGETFGHHVKNYEKTFLGKVLDLISNENDGENNKIKIISLSDLPKYFPISHTKINHLDSSWSTTYEDLQDEIPYSLWKHPDNDIHKYYWKIIDSLNRLMKFADKLDLGEDWTVENYYNTARYFYDRGLHSCPIWWANPVRGIWSPNLIYKGLELLLKAALNAQLALVHAGITKSEGYFDAISYYHGLLLMELSNTTRKNLKKSKKNRTKKF